MIGVISKPGEVWAVDELFQLFKTPWEFYVPHRHYDVVIVTADEVPVKVNARLLFVYNSRSVSRDDEEKIVTRSRRAGLRLKWNNLDFPIYGDTLTFAPVGQVVVQVTGTSEAVGLELCEGTCRLVRYGYDLFREVSFLLSKGQPAANAHTPTLEIHLALLRHQILSAGIPFVEIPPVPSDHDFMACLTHDVDFVGIRDHKFDHTMWGFIYRASLGSAIEASKGRLAWGKMLQNWMAVLSLPLVYLGLKSDFWLEFDRYSELERDLGSTYFFLPYKNRAGQAIDGPAMAKRAAKYDLAERKKDVSGLVRRGCEVGLHGIDAWHSSQKAQEELARLLEVSGQSEAGVRIHWLYFAENSPKILEDAGLSYDSTFGYNDAVGFRAGTGQVFRPAAAETLLELPLNIQDSAMFYPDRMNLSEDEALETCKQVICSAVEFGGVLTLNWHTRSLSPERLWGDFYAELLNEIQTRRVWFGTGSEIVDWFRKRRSLGFESVQVDDDRVHVKLSGAAAADRFSFVLRVHQPGSADPAHEVNRGALKSSYSDIPVLGQTELEIPLQELV